MQVVEQLKDHSVHFKWFGLGLWCLMPLSTILQLYQFYWWRKSEYMEKATD